MKLPLILTFALALSAETPMTETVNLSALDVSRLNDLDAQEGSAQNWLRAINAEREQLRLQICLRAELKATECGPFTRDSSGHVVLAKLAKPKDESKPTGAPKESKP